MQELRGRRRAERRKKPKLEMGGTGSKIFGKSVHKIQGGMNTGLKESFYSTRKKKKEHGIKA